MPTNDPRKGVIESYLHYLASKVREYKDIRAEYMRLITRPLVSVESLTPVMTKIYSGLQRGTIVDKKTALEPIKNILENFQIEIEKSMIPTLHIDPLKKTITLEQSVIVTSIVDPDILQTITNCLGDLPFNKVVKDTLYPKNGDKPKISRQLLSTIHSFLEFDKNQHIKPSQPINIQVTVRIPKTELDPILEKINKINPAETLQSSFHELQHSLRTKTYIEEKMSQTKINESFLKKPEQAYQKKFENFINALKKYEHIVAGSASQDKEKLKQIMENLHANKPIDLPGVIRFKNNIQLNTDTNNPNFYTITLEQAKSLGIITEKGSEEIKKILHQKQALCQLLQNVTEPEPFSWVEDFPEPEL